VVVVAGYLRLLAWPAGQNVDHDVPVVRSLLQPEAALSLAILAGLAGLAVFLALRARERPGRPATDPAVRLVALGIAWFFLALLVESSLIPIVDLMNEHRAYLPSAGLLVAAATALALGLRRLLPESFARTTVLAAGLAALLLSAATLRRNAVWESEVALWGDAAGKAPGKFRPWFNLGTALATTGHLPEAALALRRATEIDPDSAPARNQLGAALLQLGRPAEAEPVLRRALELQPDDPEALMNLAQALWGAGRREEARPVYRRFVAVAPASYAAARRVAAARADPASPPRPATPADPSSSGPGR
jgi:tetratricopeptide (TPR) repeat protein